MSPRRRSRLSVKSGLTATSTPSALCWEPPLTSLFLPLRLCLSAQINELSHVQIPIMLMPDDFKAYSKIKVDNHLFNK